MDNIPSITSSGVGRRFFASAKSASPKPRIRSCSSVFNPVSTAIIASKRIPQAASERTIIARVGVNHFFVRSSTSGFKFFIGDIRAEHVQHFKVSVHPPLFANKNSPVQIIRVHVPAFVPKRPYLIRQPRVVRDRGNEPLVRFQLPPTACVQPRLSLRTRRARRNRFLFQSLCSEKNVFAAAYPQSRYTRCAKAETKKKKDVPAGKSPRGNVFFQEARTRFGFYLRRRREATSASAPRPASRPNADGSGIAEAVPETAT